MVSTSPTPATTMQSKTITLRKADRLAIATNGTLTILRGSGHYCSVIISEAV